MSVSTHKPDLDIFQSAENQFNSSTQAFNKVAMSLNSLDNDWKRRHEYSNLCEPGENIEP